nr:hypothetical protein OG409_01735 [Streptomyces sp. NBC_00974]
MGMDRQGNPGQRIGQFGAAPRTHENEHMSSAWATETSSQLSGSKPTNFGQAGGRALTPDFEHVGLADLLGYAPAGVESLALEGKSASGSRTGDAPAAHLLSAVTGTGRTVTQLRVPDKSNEITGFARLLAPFDLAGTVVTADALHTQREHARFLIEEKHAHTTC